MCATVAGRRLTRLTSGSELSGSRWLRVSARFTFKLCCWPTLPPSRIEDYFYRPLRDGESRSSEAKDFFVETMKTAGITPDVAANEEAALAEFQHRGFYLAHAVECPVPTPQELSERVTSRLCNSPEAHRVLLPPKACRSHRRGRKSNDFRVAEVSNRRPTGSPSLNH